MDYEETNAGLIHSKLERMKGKNTLKNARLKVASHETRPLASQILPLRKLGNPQPLSSAVPRNTGHFSPLNADYYFCFSCFDTHTCSVMRCKVSLVRRDSAGMTASFG